MTGIAERSIRQAAEWWGTAKTSFLMHARGIEHHSHGVQNALGTINIVLASGRIGTPEVRLRHDHRPGQRPGRPRARPEVRPAPRLARHRESRAPPVHRRRLGHRRAGDCRGAGVDGYEMFRKIDAGEIKGLLSICFNPKVSLPDNNFVTRALEKLEFYVAIDFFLSETARHADIVLPGSLHEEDEGVVTQVEGRVIKINKAVDCPGEAQAGLAHHPGHRPRARPAARVHVRRARARSSRSCAWRQQGRRRRLLRHHLREDRAADRRLLAVLARPDRRADPDHPARRGCSSRARWNPVAKGAGPFYFPDGKARFNVAATRRRPRTSTTSTRSS